MGYPIGIQSFETIITGNYLYIDKTALVHKLAQEHICLLSRPRRFGKSLLISTLEAYFLGRRDLFHGLAIEQLEQAYKQTGKKAVVLIDETHYQYTFYIINRLLSCYTTLIEKQNSKGRADVIIKSDHDIYIFEFKLDGSAEDALKQIEEKQYTLPYLSDKRQLHKIGVNISSKSRTVEEWIVR